MPLVSIILPTHNRLDLLKKAVSSVYEQTFQDWELLIVYNESSDGTEEYLKEYSSPVISIIKSYRFHYPYHRIGLMLHYLQYIYAYTPEFMRERMKYILRYFKRSI